MANQARSKAKVASEFVEQPTPNEPVWDLIWADGAFSLRKYLKRTVVECLVDMAQGDVQRTTHVVVPDEAANIGFKALLRYIKQNRYPMQIPVFEYSENPQWVVGFELPSAEKYAAPADKRLRLREIPEQVMAVVQFSWLTTPGAVRRQAADLQAWLLRRLTAWDRMTAPEASEITYTDGEPNLWPHSRLIVCRYDQPWSNPLKRRNEIQLALGPRKGATKPDEPEEWAETILEWARSLLAS